jgi:hypothetical protein
MTMVTATNILSLIISTVIHTDMRTRMYLPAPV